MKCVVQVLAAVFVGGVLASGTGAAILTEANFTTNEDLNIGYYYMSDGALVGGTTVTGGRLDAFGGGRVDYVGISRTDLLFNIGNYAYWGENTVVGIVQLNETGAGTGRHALASVKASDADNFAGAIFYANGEYAGPTFSLYKYAWTAAGSLGIASEMAAGKDYFVAYSWSQPSASDPLKMRIYMREVADKTGSTAAFNQTQIAAANAGCPYYWDLGTLHVGARPTGDPLNGSVDLFQVHSTFTDTQAGFDALFNQVVPEPVSLVLLVLGGLLIRRR